MNAVAIAIQRLAGAQGLPLPSYESTGAAGMDLAAAVGLASPLILKPGERALVPTGFAIALPEGFEAQVRPRSGLAAKNGITVLNAPGTIDSDYRGEIKVLLANLGDRDFVLEHGARIAQLVVAPVARAVWNECDELSVTLRAGGGFGSTGV
jgi:dUTP pyrophosphatase